MSRWIEQFKSHPFNTEWARLQELLSNPLKDGKDAPISVAQEYARLRKVVEYVKGVIDNLDPELVPSSYLNNLHPSVQNAINEVTAFNANGNVGHLQNANAQVDQLAVLAGQSPFTAFGAVKTNLLKAATQYAETLDHHAASYATRTDDLVKGSTDKLVAIETRMTAANDELTKLETRMTAVETSANNQLASFISTFQTSESNRTSVFDTWLTKFQEKAAADYGKLTEQNAKGLVAMQSFQDDAERVLGTVIDTAQAGAYAKYANEEKTSANTFRRLAIGSMVVAALVLFAPEFFRWIEQAANYSVDWKNALYRLPFSLVLFAPALYLAKESSRHRTNEVNNRRRQHILTTIGPYLALLPQDKADAIKADVAKNVFAENLPVFDDKSPDAGSLAALAQLVALLAKNK